MAAKWSSARRLLMGMLAGFVFGLAGVALLRALMRRGAIPDAYVNPGVLAAALLMAYVVVILTHELGHMSAGLLVGFEPRLLILGPVLLQRQRTRWRLRFNRWRAYWAGGMAGCYPRDTVALRRRMLVMVAGGPAGNLLVGVGVLLLLVLAAPATATPAHAAERLAAFAVSGLSLVSGLANLIPAQRRGHFTDGGRILRLARGGPEAEGEIAILALMGTSRGGTRPREWPAALVERALTLSPASIMGVAARQLAYLHALDAGDLGTARQYLGETLAHAELVSAMGRQSLLLEGVFFRAFHEGDGPGARSLLAQARSRGRDESYLRPLAEGALALAEGDARRARELADAARRELSRHGDDGATVSVAERIAALRARAAAEAVLA